MKLNNGSCKYYFKHKFSRENQHEYDWKKVVWEDQSYDITKDIDGDLLNDEWEIKNKDVLKDEDPIGHNNWPDYQEWADNRAYQVESSYPDYSKDKDWSFPGSNY